MQTGWITVTEYFQHRGRFLLKVKQQFINGFETWKWVPQVWTGDHCLHDGNGYMQNTPEIAMETASELAETLTAELQVRMTRS